MESTTSSTALIVYQTQPWFVPKSNYTVPLEIFHKFPELPPELRLVIWNLCTPGPRLVDFNLRGTSFTTAFASTQRPPAILHINAESRLEALKIYKHLHLFPCYGSIIRNRVHGGQGIRCIPSAIAPSVFMDFERDTLFLVPRFGRNVLMDTLPLYTLRKDPEYTCGTVGISFDDGQVPEIRNIMMGMIYTEDPLEFSFDRYYQRIFRILTLPGHIFEKVTLVLYDSDHPNYLRPFDDEEITAFKDEFLEYWAKCAARSLHLRSRHPIPPRPATLLHFEVKCLDQFPIDEQPSIVSGLRECQRELILHESYWYKWASVLRRGAQWRNRVPIIPVSRPSDTERFLRNFYPRLLPWHTSSNSTLP